MTYRESARATARTGASNPVGIAVVSVAVSLSALPLLAALAVGTVPAALGGLWTSCLLFGLAVVSLFGFATVAADRDAAVSALPHLAASVKRPWPGIGLGAVTFVVLVIAFATGLAPDRIRAAAVGAAAFLLVCWYVVVAFAAPELGDGAALIPALRAGFGRFARAPLAALWFLLLSLVCLVVAGITVVTLAVFLPGVLGVLAVHVAAPIGASTDSRAENGPGERDG